MKKITLTGLLILTASYAVYSSLSTVQVPPSEEPKAVVAQQPSDSPVIEPGKPSVLSEIAHELDKTPDTWTPDELTELADGDLSEEIVAPAAMQRVGTEDVARQTQLALERGVIEPEQVAEFQRERTSLIQLEKELHEMEYTEELSDQVTQ